MHNERDRNCLERLSRNLETYSCRDRQQSFYRFFKSYCAQNPPMDLDSSSIVDVRSGVTSIIQEFSEATELFKKWRKGRAGKKAQGQEECETSLHEGQSTIEGALNRLSLQHGARFDRGDRECLDNLINIRKSFREAVVEVLTRCVAGKLSKADRTDPLVLRRTSEATRRDTVVAMDDLSRRIGSGTAGPYMMTDPGDVLPPMPLRRTRPPRPPGASASSSQTSVASTPQGISGNDSSQTAFPNPQASQASFATTSPGSANSSQTSLGTPFAPIPQRNNVYMPTSSWKPPDFGTSQALVRTRPSSSATALSWMKDMFPIKPTRPYYDIAPLKPTPAVVPTFKCDNDAVDILEEGRRAAQKLWDAADCVENDQLRLQARSAPITQGPWKSMFGDDDDNDDEEHRPQTPLSQKRETTPPTPDEDNSQMFLRPVLPGARPSSAQGKRRIRSEPMLEFSVPTPRFRRHASGPETTRAN